MDIEVGKAAADFKVAALMSMPRLAWTDNMVTMNAVASRLGIPVTTVTGAFWGQCMANGIEDLLASENPPDAVLFVDYDSVFTPKTVQALVALMAWSGADALAPLQVKRQSGALLFSKPGVKPGDVLAVDQEWFSEPVREAATAHFGCTLVRTSCLRKVAKPWFAETQDEDGGYRKDHEDADICFWRKFREAGNRLFVATGVSIGHLEVKVAWPSLASGDGRIYSDPAAFWSHGAPDGAHGVNA